MKEKIKKIYAKYNAFILGENKFAPLRKRMFVLILWVSILIAIVGNLVNTIFNFPPQLIYFTAAITIGLVIIYNKVITRPNIDYEKYLALYWGLILIAIPSIWVYNSGIDGNNIMLIFIVFVGMFLTVKPSYRLKTLVTFILLITALLLLDFYYPQYIVRYTKVEQRIADLILGYALYITLLYALLNLLVKNTEYEQAKLKIRNNQLSLITEKADKLNEQLKSTIEELEQANYSKDRFISIIAHDLRSPYQGLLGVSKILISEYESLEDVEKKELIIKLNNLLEKQYEFLDDLLLWGRIQRNAVSVNKEIANIHSLVKSTVNIFEEALHKKRISVKITGNVESYFETDDNLLSTVVRNVFSNAVKFSVVGGTIDINIDSQSKLIISITDYGVGINEADQKKIFRVEESISRKGTDGEVGTGLGLIVCYEIIKKLNGNITVRSKEGAGTTVTIELK